MSGYRPCKCCYCQRKLDRNVEEFIEVNKRFAHKNCKVVYDNIHDYCRMKYGDNYFKSNIDKQIKEMTETGKTLAGIYKTLVWWYDIHGGDVAKAHGSIRIVNTVYGDAMDYYVKKEKAAQKNAGVIVQEQEPERYTIHPTPLRKPKKIRLFDLK